MSDGSTQTATPAADVDRGRVFPCEKCGADLTFNIGQQDLKCPYCGFEKPLDISPDAKLEEQDYQAMLERLSQRRSERAPELPGETIVRCTACGATVVFAGTLTSSECAYCGAPVQLEKIDKPPGRVPVDGVLPFHVEHDKAQDNLKSWVRSRWFAPQDFVDAPTRGKFNGVYLPYWTFDAMTSNRYWGLRGENYFVTVGTGKQQRQEVRVAWHQTSGSFQLFFDDVLAVAATGLPADVMVALEPWPLRKTLPFNAECLAGFQARSYDTPLDQGFLAAKARMDDSIEDEVRRRIGGDQQQIQSIDTQHSALTYKHLLLPVWLLAYRYHDKAYLVAVNGVTGAVEGQRPYSWWKIAAAALVAAALATLFALYFNQH